MMGLPVTSMAGFLTGTGILDGVLLLGAVEVSEIPGVGAVVETLKTMMIFSEVVVEVIEEPIIGLEVLEALVMIG